MLGFPKKNKQDGRRDLLVFFLISKESLSVLTRPPINKVYVKANLA